MIRAAARASAFALALALALAAGTSAVAAPVTLKAGSFEPPAPAPALDLAGSDGRPLTLARFRGRVVLLAFGFTRCPAICPTTLATLAAAHRALGADAAALQVVYVTVDPERDDAATVKAYLAGFDRSFVGGTGSVAAIEDVEKRYGVTARKVPMAGGDYAVSHSSGIYLIDPEGRLRGLMPYGHEPADFVHDVRALAGAR